MQALYHFDSMTVTSHEVWEERKVQQSCIDHSHLHRSRPYVLCC